MSLGRRKFISLNVLAFVGVSSPIGYKFLLPLSQNLAGDMAFEAMRMDIKARFDLECVPQEDLLAFYRGEHSSELHARLYASAYLINKSLFIGHNKVQFGVPGYLVDPTLAEVKI